MRTKEWPEHGSMRKRKIEMTRRTPSLFPISALLPYFYKGRGNICPKFATENYFNFMFFE
jgi:hypothetical protein